MTTARAAGGRIRARREAGYAARRWLNTAAAPSRELEALRRFGLTLSETLLAAPGGFRRHCARTACLPDLMTVMRMDRAGLLGLMQAVHAAALAPEMPGSGRDAPPREPATRGSVDAARMIGGLALSFARAGDVPAVAVLLRASAVLRLEHAWLREAETYLLEQQGPDGRFGLMLSELSSLKLDRAASGPWLRLTVEVLWALAERQGAHGPKTG